MTAPGGRKPALGFIFITLVLIVLGFGVIIPVLPGLITEFEGGSVANASRYYGVVLTVFALMQFFGSPILGALSDRYGRRPVILISQAGTAIDYVIMGLAPSLVWLFVARAVSGATAGGLATCNAYIADVTPPEKRAAGFGLVGAAFGIGFVVGPALGGLAGQYSLRLPFFIAAAFVGANALYGIFVLPESLPPEKRRALDLKRMNPVGSLLALRNFPGVLDLALMYFIYNLGLVMLQGTWVLYTAYRYHWGTGQIGISLMVAGLSMGVIQGRLTRPILARIGEKRGLVCALIFSALIYCGYGWATQGWMIYPLIVLSGFGGLAGPAAQSLITRHVPADQQGAVQGSLFGLASLGNIVAPLFATWSFSACIRAAGFWHLPGIAFFESAFFFLGAMCLALLSFRQDARVQPS